MTEPTRPNDRLPDQLRPIRFTRGYTTNTPGSVLVEFGDTVVLCTVSFEDRVPPWRRDSGKGWVTAEYSMLPGSSAERIRRERKGAGGRTKEIERLIGRSLRATVDFDQLPPVQLTVDCDVLQADGGTRTASITGGFVALQDAVNHLIGEKSLGVDPLVQACAAVSVGIVGGRPVLDLEYVEDSAAETDMNVVMTADGRFVEVQGTAEGVPFDRAELNALLDLAEKGCRDLFAMQQTALGM